MSKLVPSGKKLMSRKEKKKKRNWIAGVSPAVLLMLGQHYQLSPCPIFMGRHKIIELKYRSAITSSYSKYHGRKGYLIKAGKPEAWQNMLAGLLPTDHGTRFMYAYIHTHTFTHAHISLANQYYSQLKLKIKDFCFDLASSSQ